MTTKFRPTLHINGTSATSLQDDLLKGITAINDALGALTDTRPNARDYYPQGVDGFTGAATEYQERASKMIEVRDELTDLWRHIDGVTRNRDAARAVMAKDVI